MMTQWEQLLAGFAMLSLVYVLPGWALAFGVASIGCYFVIKRLYKGRKARLLEQRRLDAAVQQECRNEAERLRKVITLKRRA